jgi:UV DNA damage endonuclease
MNTLMPSSSRTLRLARVTPERLRELIASNLEALEAILRWNLEHDILLFRLTSNLVPFASHPANTVRWWELFAEQFAALGDLMRTHQMRLSTHPGQYTVLGSPREEVTRSSVAELEYHARMLRAFGLDASHKIVIHLGGAYDDRRANLARTVAAFGRLSGDVQARLAFEHDERWSLEEALALAEQLDVPVVFDAFHQVLRPSFQALGVRELVVLAGGTWKPRDGRQEVHFSTQQPGLRPGAHAQTLDLDAFARFVAEVGDLPLDCLIEVKDKEQSVLRAQAFLRQRARGTASAQAG